MKKMSYNLYFLHNSMNYVEKCLEMLKDRIPLENFCIFTKKGFKIIGKK